MMREVILYEASEGKELDSFYHDLSLGFEKRPKIIPSKYMYDSEGSKLFSKWIQRPEYYIWRSEKELVEENADQILRLFGKQKYNLIDLGAGDATKTKILLRKALEMGVSFEYIPLDISKESNDALAETLKSEFPTLSFTLLTSKFKDGVKWVCENKKERNIFLFMGATIGNIEQMSILKEIIKSYSQVMKKGDLFITGFDKLKDPFLIQQAYSNTGRPLEPISKNLLQKINKELHGNLNLEHFYEHSYYDPIEKKIMGNLISKSDQTFIIRGKEFSLEEGEPVRFLCSRKWRMDAAEKLFSEFGFEKISIFEDKNKYFAQIYFEKV